uniref:N-acetyltransferase domain-containing protein n=1 Tax=Plectus sambesii TaxID=2011161 RepID=A0A914W9V8_9BILA
MATSASLANWQGAKAPDHHRVLEGRYVRLEALDPARHGDDLWRQFQGPGSDTKLWDYMSYGPFPNRADFDAFLSKNAESADPLFYAVVDVATGEAQGELSYLRIAPAHGNIEIGHVAFGASMQRSVKSTEAVYLMAEEAFALGNRRLEWKCNNENDRSKRAAERFGFLFEGVFRQHMVVKGCNRDTAWYSILDGEWPKVRSAFVKWLADDNFDEHGRQKHSLSALREAH